MKHDELKTDALDDLSREIVEWREQQTREALAETDWEETPIVDIVTEHPGLAPFNGDGEFEVPTTKLHIRRYQHPPPRVEESSIDGSRCDVQRVTRPLYEKIRREYPELVGDDGVGPD